MDNQTSQPVNTGAAPAPSASEVAAAETRIQELKADKEWGKRYTTGGGNSAEAHELDRLQRTVVAGKFNPAPPPAKPVQSRPVNAPAPAAAEISSEEARAQIKRNQSNREWVKKYMAGDLATRRENDRLLQIAAGGVPDPGALTVAEQARAN